MLTQIVTHIPVWVLPLLLALLWLGLSQTKTRSVSLTRITIMPLVMTGLSLQGTIAAGAGHATVLLPWLLGAGLSASLVLRQALPAQTRYDDWTQRFTLPGSWAPLFLILGIFVTKFTVGATLAMQPGLSGQVHFSLGLAALYGAFSGIFLGRAARLWRLARRGAALRGGSIVSS